MNTPRFRGISGVLFLLLCLSGFEASATRWYVDAFLGDDTWDGTSAWFVSGTTGPKNTITAALSVASPGDTIQIGSGTYNESVTISYDVYFDLTSASAVRKLRMGTPGIQLHLIGGTFTATDTLQLDSGLIYPAPGIFRITDTAKLLGGSVNSYVNGRLYREVSVKHPSLFYPIGKGKDYRPTFVEFDQGSAIRSDYFMELHTGLHPVVAPRPSGIRNISNIHWWEFDGAGPGVPNGVTMVLSYDTKANDDEVFEGAELRIVYSKYKTDWTNLGGSGFPDRNGSITSLSNADSAGIFTLGNSDTGFNLLGDPRPVARMHIEGYCEGDSIRFADSSFTYPGSIADRFWYFGNGPGDTAHGKFAAFKYPGVGPYTVQLVVTNSFGLKDTLEKTITLRGKPVPSFSYAGQCAGDTTKLRDLSSITGPDYVQNWFWTLSPGGSFGTQNVDIKYTGSTNVTAKLVLVSNTGCSDSTTQTFKVDKSAGINMGITGFCLGDSTSFNYSPAGPGDAAASGEWYIDGNLTSTDGSFKVKFLKDTTYQIKAYASTTNGCKDSASKTIVINGRPKPGINVADVCKGDTSYFSAIKPTKGDSVVSYKWYINGTYRGAGMNFKTRFAGAGTYLTKLVATTVAGCRDSTNKVTTVNGNPAVLFYLDKTIALNDSLQCAKFNLYTFKPVITVPAGQTLSSGFWHWGDSGQDTLTDSMHAYVGPGTYTVKLLAQTNKGCRDSWSYSYRVKNDVIAAWRYTGYCLPGTVKFYDSSTYTGGTIASAVRWYIEGNTYTGDSTSYNYTLPGTYKVKMETTNSDGCTDSVTRTLVLPSRPVVGLLPIGTQPFCPGDSIRVKVNGGKNVLWIADSDTSSTKAFRTQGKYYVRVFNSPQCYSDDSFSVFVHPAAVANAGNDTTIVRGKSMKLNGSGGGTYKWSPGNYLSSTVIRDPSLRPTQNVRYILQITDANGCKDDDTVNVTVAEPTEIRIPNIITPNGDGQNDLWDLIEVKGIDNCEIKVFGQSGKMIFSTIGLQNTWDGKDAGKDLPEGLYLYHIKCGTEIYKGFVQLIR